MHTATDNIALVAPRPVRLSTFSQLYASPHRAHSLRLVSAPVDSADRFRPSDDENDDPPDARPRRSGLPSEALEEFLSILRPALFPPQSPTLRARRYPITTLHDRSLSLSSKPLDRLENVPILSREEARTPAKASPRTPRPEIDENDSVPELTPPRLYGSGPLASPISRVHTRNPFQRHASYEGPYIPGTGLFLSSDAAQPAQTLLFPPASVSVSPAMVPLPSPTPSELENSL
ncbi:hypothetical protein BV25DRAFT_1883979 [Artomyces pyxidatus]|uniref:Uncharacterized protein n=1 Tax=Artomyces pyxidatus TaxID=48021 RepID=A0ACB8T6B6_9AGAM|nr:hypothetical protein BV25DRAFT_1883979 [Artomyces pyxidatus]